MSVEAPHHRGELVRVSVAVGLACVLLSLLASMVSYHPSTHEVMSGAYTLDLIATIGCLDGIFTFAIGTLVVGALVQIYRVYRLYQYGVCHALCAQKRRSLDLVLLVQGSLMLLPAVDASSSKWSDWTFYAYSVPGLVLVWGCVLGVLWTNRCLNQVIA